MGARAVVTQILRAALWLMVAGIVAQVFLAGLFNFGESEALETHEGVGWAVHTIGMVALVVLNTVQILLSTVDTAAVAALHPTLALAVLGLTMWLALRLRPRPA